MANATAKVRQQAGAVNAKYIAAHGPALTILAKALGFTFDEFLATKTSKGILAGYRNVDVRAHRPVTAKVFASCSVDVFKDVRDVFAYVCCRSARLADSLRAAGK